MNQLVVLLLFLGACSSPDDSSAPNSADAGGDISETDTSPDLEVVLPAYSVTLQSEKIAVGATQVVTVHFEGRPFAGEIDWTINGNATKLSPMRFQGESTGLVELSAVVAGEALHASFEVVAPRWKAISAGKRATCVLDADDEAYCMGHQGNDAFSALTKVPGGHKFQEISVGTSFACGIASGDVYCWGENTAGQLGAGSDVDWSAEPIGILMGENVTEISAGLYFACGSSSTKSWCWGASDYYQTGRFNAPYQPLETREHYHHISTGHYHSCGIRDDGVAVCWGGNFLYQIEATNRNVFDLPWPVSQPNQFVSIHPGRFHTCARASDGAVTCWGTYLSNPSGFFNQTEIGRSFEHLSVNGGITCGINATNSLECLGQNIAGILGAGDTAMREDWTRVPGSWWKFDGSNDHGCALDLAGELFCWGANYSGAFGQDLQPIVVNPTELVGISVDDFVFAAGVICWLDNGVVACRGESTNGLLGDDRFSPSVYATPLLPTGEYTRLYAAGQTVCALSQTGDLYCWGAKSGFDFNDAVRPQKVSVSGPITDVFLGPAWNHRVLLADGRVRYWDSVNYFPNLTGQENVSDSNQQPLIIQDYQYLNYTRVVLTQDNQLYCGGRLCDSDAVSGQPDLGVSNVKSIHLVEDLLCALDDSGELWCVRGINGFAKWTAEEWPVAISAASHGPDVICVLDAQGVACLGSNRGQAQGVAPEIAYSTLHRIQGTAGATDVRVGHNNVCAKISGKWKCWGDNEAGQLTETEIVFLLPTPVSP